MIDIQIQERLLKFARHTITTQILPETTPLLLSWLETLRESTKERCGCFVTLHLGDMLRGCIGTFDESRSLYDVVYDMSLQSAFHDPRFEGLTRSQLPFITIEISVLSPRVKIFDLSQIKVGQHGLYVTHRDKQGVLLPQVAVEYDWDSQTFLEQTCLKARLSKSAWKEGATIEVFEAEIFREESSPE